jgi:hypothetical protein
MFDILPPIVGDIMILVSLFFGSGGIIWAYLQRKGANRSLIVEEGGLEVNQFNALTAKYAELLTRAEKAAQTASDDAKAARDANVQMRDDMQGQINTLGDDLREVRSLFMDVVRQHGIKLTPEQQRRFESTKPPRARRTPRPA